MSGAERQDKNIINQKDDDEFQDRRFKIETGPLRKIKRAVRELNQGKKEFKTLPSTTIKEYGI